MNYRTIPKKDEQIKSDGKITIWTCDYGTQHTMNVGIYEDQFGEKQWSGAKCGCDLKFKIPHSDWIEYCQQKYGINYPHQVRKYMRDDYFKNLNQIQI